MSATVLAESDIGYVIFEGNELTIGSKVDDPPKVRFTAPIDHRKGGGGGALSFNHSRHYGVICPGSDQGEMGLLRVEQAFDVRGTPSNLKGEMSIQLSDGGDQDSAMGKVLDFTLTVVDTVSSAFRQLFGGAASTDRMCSVDGRFTTVQQGDGNFVTYDANLGPLSPETAIWSAWHGKIRNPAPG